MFYYKVLKVLIVLIKFHVIRVNVSNEYITLPSDTLGVVNDVD